MSTYGLEIITPERVFFEGEVEKMVIRGQEGEFAVLANHTPLVTGLATGILRIFTSEKQWKEASLSGGFIKVTPTQVTVLTDAAEWPEEIDVDRAKEALERAEKYAKEKDKYDYARAQAAIKRALIRIQVAEKHGQHR
ncbi:F0F1 ATP synthase subunit epsilon [Irregularibacter muris]|uniref:ATP synthase epsilon chain n=1 Tax=Irregularibacter muris TaxID=1796619 RepID=A0AAE3HIY0_9FIRM|nr:F0F1 ATP synthase subunit epsilon [Irregularibacter muris]MCR1900200.1 F0F1 ATP synthase subunit epsilon [Irregularibacter muris]